MRHSVLAGVLEVAAANLQHTDDVRLFEIGSVYLPRPGKKLPDEPRRLALVLCGPAPAGVLGRCAGRAGAAARFLRPEGRGRSAGRRSAPGRA